MKYIVLIFLLQLFSLSLSEVVVTPKIQCRAQECEGDNFCFQGYCTSCEITRRQWNQGKPLWGTKVGEAIKVPAYSNFGDPNVLDTKKDEFLEDSKRIFGEEVYVGQKYQCVQFARRFWIVHYNSTFGSVNYAEQIFYLQQAYNFNTKQSLQLKKFQNGDIHPPQQGDLLIWKKDEEEFPYGHVAIVISVEMESSYPHVLIAEQNYDQSWDARSFSRALRLIKGENNEITISNNRQIFPTREDLKCRDTEVTSQGVILGWVRLNIQ
ncbi:unnamed protein product (macronuclear) [Paramecium tetraurelia]|uniref:Peptidase C51 domain-containing protein n=1 Tax=Paramecium tetraurelia TaxID=5888 RepID=A0CRR7_PARTE|nr:uncharacterized protein GSPATT00009799001 [Paramecium tetraurelia]CAK73484.1 unnamed protein product [Paramecium tetraurelia]|eukprot:XP_001440881.1 hypothetical protein (macronuclear) [Paramecium tetraurelia strain d4-2]